MKNFVWAGRFRQFLEPGTRAQHWMTAPLAGLPAGDGGVSLPNVELELQTMAALTVAQWCYNPTGLRHATVRALCPNATWVQPGLHLSRPQTPPRAGTDLWESGQRALEWIYSSSMDYPTQLLIHDAQAALRQSRDWRWWRGELERDYTAFYRTGGREINRLRQRHDGRLAPEWIPHIGITASTPIIWTDGTLLSAKHLAPLGAGATIDDFVTWQWVGHHTMRFRPRAPFPLSNPAAAVFRALCDALVANFPDLTCRPDEPARLRTYNIPPTADVMWKWCPQQGLTRFEQGAPAGTDEAPTQHQLQRQPAVSIDNLLLVPQFECTPRLTRLVQPWRGLKPWRPARRLYMRALGRADRQAGHDARRKREERWEEANWDIAEALASVPWHEFNRTTGLTDTDRQLWARIRLHQLNAWPRPPAPNGCPRRHCDHPTTATTAHILWECPRATTLWIRLAHRWGATDITPPEVLQAVFSRRPPQTSYDWRRQLNGRASRITDRLDYWKQQAWTLLVTSGCSRLWRACVHSLLDDSDDSDAADYFATMHDWNFRLRSALGGITSTPEGEDHDTNTLDSEIIKQLLTITAGEDPPPPIPSQKTGYVLFFDGGSRGNPGPGGSGSVIIQIGETPAVTWAAAMSYANMSTTNNIAEYKGLCTGLKAAERYGFLPLAVVGDSQMIIRQMQERRRPKNARLRQLYEDARSTADAILVKDWRHHYRSHNKMADKAANQAMDSGASYQALSAQDRPELHDLRHWLSNDINHWLETNPHRSAVGRRDHANNNGSRPGGSPQPDPRFADGRG